MKSYIKKGIGFGLTSGVITTLGMLIGLSAISESKVIVVGGIISIAIADAASDALGIHIAEESHEESKLKHIWTATLSTFISKFVITSSFILPVFFFELKTAVIISILWGFSLLTVFSYKIAKDRNENPVISIFEHLSIASFVLIIIHITGDFIKKIQ